MAEVKHTRGVKLVLKIGDGATPQVFTPFCSINAERGITFTTALNDEVIPDCTDPDKIAWVAREKVSRSMSFTGGGMLHKSDVKRAWDLDESEDAADFQVILDDDDVDNVIMWEGAFHMSEFGITGNRGEKAQFNANFSSDGPITATFGANVGAA